MQIREVSHDSKMARVVRTDANWITEPRSDSFLLFHLSLPKICLYDRDFTNIDAVQTFRIREIRESPHKASYGRRSSARLHMYMIVEEGGAQELS